MTDILKTLAFVRRITEAIAAGRLDAAAVDTMTDEQLIELDAAAYGALKDAQATNELLAAGGVDED